MRIAILGLLAFLLAACQEVQVQRVEPAAPPVVFSTYAWSQAPLASVSEASARLVELDQDMREVVTSELQRRGYRQVDDTERADMVVDYQVALVEEQFADKPSDPSWDAQFDTNAPTGVVELPARISAPRVTLTLSIGHPGGATIWGGTASKLLTRPESGEERKRIIGIAVRELLKDLPAAY